MSTWVEGAAGSVVRRRQPAVRRVLAARRGAAGRRPDRRAGARPGGRCPTTRNRSASPRSTPSWPAAAEARRANRTWVTDLLTDETGEPTWSRTSRPSPTSTLHLPVEVGDYVDFYASLDHATNVGRIFRPDAERADAELAAPADRLPRPLRHGRAQRYAGRPPARPAEGAAGRTPRRTARAGGSTSRPSSASSSVRRPRWPTRSPVDDFAEHVFGLVGLNDWSARDIQAWEYVPLGPFLGKSFATSISHWVTPLEALDAAWVDLPGQDPAPLPYLHRRRRARPRHRRRGGAQRRRSSAGRRTASMYWSPAQMLAHMTVNGASLRTGDLFASGTISGPERGPAGLVPRAVLGRPGAVRTTGAPSSRTATTWCCATPPPAPAAAGSPSARWPAGSSRRGLRPATGGGFETVAAQPARPPTSLVEIGSIPSVTVTRELPRRSRWAMPSRTRSTPSATRRAAGSSSCWAASRSPWRCLADQLPVSRPAVSRHLRLLKEAGFVEEVPDGTRRVYHVRDDGLEATAARQSTANRPRGGRRPPTSEQRCWPVVPRDRPGCAGHPRERTGGPSRSWTSPRAVGRPTTVTACSFGQYPAPGHVVAHFSDPHLLADDGRQYGVRRPRGRTCGSRWRRLDRLEPAAGAGVHRRPRRQGRAGGVRPAARAGRARGRSGSAHRWSG